MPQAPFVPNTVISSNAVNDDLSDIALAITGSIAADGQTAITAPIKFALGNASAPGITWIGDTNTGFYADGSGGIGWATDGVTGATFNAGGTVTWAFGATWAGNVTFNGTVTVSSTLTLSGAVTISSILSLTSTSHMALPSGTTGQRPVTPAASYFRYNTTTGAPEFYDGVNWHQINPWTTPQGYIDSCIIANGTDAVNDINFGTGICRDSSNSIDITCTALTKQLDANWVAGDNQGMRDTSAGIANTTYHLYAVAKTSGGSQDYYATTAATPATALAHLQAEPGGASYLYVRRIASIIRSGATILAFSQDGDEFLLSTPVNNVNGGAIATQTALTPSVTTPVGIKTRALLSALYNNAQQELYISSPDVADAAASTTVFTVYGVATGVAIGLAIPPVRTNTSSQVRVRASNASTYSLTTLGWLDQRGKNGGG